MPKTVISTNSAETEKVTDATAEKRAADQDAAIETAFADGTLPEEDRRAAAAAAGPAPNVAPTLGEPNPETVATSRAIPAGRRQFIGPDGRQIDVSVGVRDEHGLGPMLAMLPPGSRVTWSNELVPGGVWRVERGPGNNKAVGEGATLRRALRMVGAKMGRHPEDQLRQVLLDEQDRPIHPHLGTDPDPSKPEEQPKTVDGDGNVVDAPTPAEAPATPPSMPEGTPPVLEPEPDKGK